MSLFLRQSFDTGCTIEVAHDFDNVHAHVVLDGDIAIEPGDRVKVHGRRIVVPFGGRLTERRTATVTRATAPERIWTRLRSRFEVTELYEVWFSDGRPT